jgi:hypothetical protein
MRVLHARNTGRILNKVQKLWQKTSYKQWQKLKIIFEN